MPGVSKVSYGDEVLIDLTNDTVDPSVLLSGYLAHSANGDQIRGALILGALAYLNSIDYSSNFLINKPNLGALSPLDYIDYSSNYLRDKPHLGALSSRDYIEYSSSFLTNKPDFHKLAFQDFIDYESDQLINKPVFGKLAWQDKISYESDQLTDKPRPISEIMDDLYHIYPDMPKGIRLAISAGSGSMTLDNMIYHEDNGVHVYDEYTDWFIPKNENGITGIQIIIKEQLTDFVKPILGDLAYDDVLDYESDKLINKPPSASEIIKSITAIYPDLPSGISFVINAESSHEIGFSDGVIYYDDNGGVVINDPNQEGISAEYVSEDYGIRLIFPPLQFIRDVPDDNKLYARRHGEWVEITV